MASDCVPCGARKQQATTAPPRRQTVEYVVWGTPGQEHDDVFDDIVAAREHQKLYGGKVRSRSVA